MITEREITEEKGNPTATGLSPYREVKLSIPKQTNGILPDDLQMKSITLFITT
jgi:hypothetical protein